MRFDFGPKLSFVLGVASLVCLGMLDFATGYELQFFVFYFAPIALVAWNMRLGWGFFMAFACAATWFAVDRLSGHAYSSYFYLHWNTAVRLASFLTIAYTINKVQKVLIKERLLNAELTQALVQVKQLNGLLPICASCKSIRNDTGYWEQIESYVSTHSDAAFSHGICPACMEKLYPEYCEKKSADSNGGGDESGPSSGALIRP